MNLDDITTGPVVTVSEIIDLADVLFNPAQQQPPTWAFRGQPRDYGNLAPSFQRQFSRKSFGTAQIIERRLIDAFRSHYVNLKDRSADMPQPEHLGPGYDLRCLSVMQHYEIPTRLLDWTSDYWTAIYFACASEPDSKAELWYYDRKLFDAQRKADPSLLSLFDMSTNPPQEPPLLNPRAESLIVELDPRLTPRMKQQFAHHTVSTSVFSDHAPLLWELRQKASPDTTGAQSFRRVLIDASCKSKALQFLADEMNITASTVFPDVVGLGRFLRWQFESLRTMLM